MQTPDRVVEVIDDGDAEEAQAALEPRWTSQAGRAVDENDIEFAEPGPGHVAPHRRQDKPDRLQPAPSRSLEHRGEGWAGEGEVPHIDAVTFQHGCPLLDAKTLAGGGAGSVRHESGHG